MVAQIVVVFLLRPFTSKREIKKEPDLRLTLEQDSLCVKLITKSYTTCFLNNLLSRGWLVINFWDNYRFQNFYTTVSLHYTGLPFLFSIKKLKCHDYFNTFNDVKHGFRSCVVQCCFVVVLHCKSVAQAKGGKTLLI